MRTRDRNHHRETARISRTEDPDSRVNAHHGDHNEQYERPEDQHHSADGPDYASAPDTRPHRRAIDWEVGDERVEFAKGPGREQHFKPLRKLIPAEPPLSRRVPQPFGNLLPIGV